MLYCALIWIIHFLLGEAPSLARSSYDPNDALAISTLPDLNRRECCFSQHEPRHAPAPLTAIEVGVIAEEETDPEPEKFGRSNAPHSSFLTREPEPFAALVLATDSLSSVFPARLVLRI